jgi:hypothetical protein
MTRASVRFALSATLIAMLVWLVGAVVLGVTSRAALTAGVAAAAAFQALTFWLLAGVFFPRKPAMVYGLGMLGRFLLVAGMALVGVPALGVPAMPTLFALLATLFATTLLEPVFISSAHSTAR